MASTDHPNYQDLIPNTAPNGFGDMEPVDDHAGYQDFGIPFWRPYVRGQLNPGLQKPGGGEG